MVRVHHASLESRRHLVTGVLPFCIIQTGANYPRNSQALGTEPRPEQSALNRGPKKRASPHSRAAPAAAGVPSGDRRQQRVGSRKALTGRGPSINRVLNLQSMCRRGPCQRASDTVPGVLLQYYERARRHGSPPPPRSPRCGGSAIVEPSSYALQWHYCIKYNGTIGALYGTPTLHHTHCITNVCTQAGRWESGDPNEHSQSVFPVG